MLDTPLRSERRQERPVPHYPVDRYPYQPRSTSPSPLTQPDLELSSRRVRLAQVAMVLGIVALSAMAYGLHDGLRSEVGRALAILTTGDGVAIGAYLRSYGVWAPVASLFLMLLQAVAAPVPAILVAFANGLAFGVVWGGLLTVAGQTLAAAVCFWIARALGRGPVDSADEFARSRDRRPLAYTLGSAGDHPVAAGAGDFFRCGFLWSRPDWDQIRPVPRGHRGRGDPTGIPVRLSDPGISPVGLGVLRRELGCHRRHRSRRYRARQAAGSACGAAEAAIGANAPCPFPPCLGLPHRRLNGGRG